MKTKSVLLLSLTLLFSVLFSGFDQKSVAAPEIKSKASKYFPISIDARFLDVSCSFPYNPGPYFITAEVEYPYTDFKVGDRAWFRGHPGHPGLGDPLNGLYQIYDEFSNLGDTFEFVNGVAVSTAVPC